MQSSNQELLGAREAAKRLGVKLDTLYAYVSRGLLASVEVPGSRQRRYRSDDVERFRAGRGSEKARAAIVPIIDSAISLIENGRFYYRGRDALALADRATLEDVAALLWGVGVSEDAAVSGAPASRRQAGRRPALPLCGLMEGCQIALAGLAAEDMAALDLTPRGVARTGRAILYALSDCIAPHAIAERQVHRRLAARWRLDPAGAELVRRCLVLIADHELNASTFVARCVASTGATPYAVVGAALAALSGRRHGGASASAEALFHEIGPERDPMTVMAARLARGDSLPGLGQPLYPDGDPRAAAILAAIAVAVPAAKTRVEAAAAAAQRLTGQHPNVDFALAAAVSALGLPAGSALAIFVLGRTVGWIAHAIEQYDGGALIRPRARYIGPRPAVAAGRARPGKDRPTAP